MNEPALLLQAKKEVSELKESIQGLKDKNNGGMGEQCLAAVVRLCAS
jgi:hypothetical protein